MIRWLDSFLFDAQGQANCVLLRIGFGALVVVNSLIWLLDVEYLFSIDGVMSTETANELLSGSQLGIFQFIPPTPAFVRLACVLLLAQGVCLTLGLFSRFQAVCIFLWLTSFQHQNPLVCDGEDTVFRLFAFFLIFMPLDSKWSLAAKLGVPVNKRVRPWALRLVQIEMTLIYASAAWCKADGETWREGTALFYVYQIQDLFGRGWIPEFMLETPWCVAVATWSVVAVEALLPVLLWLPKTRFAAVLLGVFLHLSIEYSMHLFLFQWIMILGLSAFIPLAGEDAPGRYDQRTPSDTQGRDDAHGRQRS